MPSELHERCKQCAHKDDCDEKRMVACAYMTAPPPLTAEVVAPRPQLYAEPITQPHDYRNIKIAKNTTVTIDLEEIKERLVRDIARSLDCPEYFQAAA